MLRHRFFWQVIKRKFSEIRIWKKFSEIRIWNLKSFQTNFQTWVFRDKILKKVFRREFETSFFRRVFRREFSEIRIWKHPFHASPPLWFNQSRWNWENPKLQNLFNTKHIFHKYFSIFQILVWNCDWG